jgi:uncharacterized protein YndB with AHSA1/START domain
MAEREAESAVTHATTLEAPPDEVWTILTDDDELSTWLGDEAELDAVPGGSGRVVDDEGVRRCIRVDEVTEGAAIRWSWWPEDAEGDATSVEITLVPVPGGTEVRVVETVPVASLHRLDALDSAGPPDGAFDATWACRFLDVELELLTRQPAVLTIVC